MLKTINPETIYEWQYEDSIFYYKALAGPQTVFTVDALYNALIDKCVTKVTNIEINGVEHKEWVNDGSLSSRLPFAIANQLAAAIFDVSRLTQVEAKNSPSPSGQVSSEIPGGVVVSVSTSNATKKSTKKTS